MLWLVILAFVVLSGFLIYGGYLYYYKKEKFSEQKSIIEFISIFLSIFFAIFTIYQTSESIKSSQEDSSNLIKKIDTVISSANNAKDILDSVSLKLAPLPNQLNDFSNSINTLNSVIESQQNKLVDNINKLESGIGKLTTSIKDYRNYINDYSLQLKQIVAQTDTQLKLWREQQEIVRKDYERKPILSMLLGSTITKDSTYNVTELILKNDGNIVANIYGIIISIHKDYILPKGNFNEWKMIKQEGLFNQYLFRQEKILSFPIASNSRRSLKLELKDYPILKLNNIILYEIFYESRFNDGSISGIIVLD